ncbi:hypothetical protein FEM48_Zijuj07G0089500 [Ziziphus jujuba var. spinosa]|uniref:EF-hand domain-containing protein n=1 Tax=Ziziphus jujuba var. spinosa TaxID=714518 RepID=A0A978V3P8_ZIZJJ|nr:hypothetical protein FEM48_Zijuj07G0089500 [Ziziphus jujuba var. spinosa]
MADRACSNSSSSLRQLIWDFFQSMDTNHDGRVSFLEFTQFLQQNGYNRVNPNIINNLDTDGDRCLDFYEVLTFYYIVKTRSVWCDSCRANLHSLYFTCVECFDS